MRISLFFTYLLVFGSVLSPSARPHSDPLPIIDSEIVFTEGGFNSFCSLQVSYKWSVDRNAVDKMQGELKFQSALPGHYCIPFRKPFHVVKTGRPDLPQYFEMKLVPLDEDRENLPMRVTIDLQSMGGDVRSTKPPNTYRIIIIGELDDFISGVAALRGVSRS